MKKGIQESDGKNTGKRKTRRNTKRSKWKMNKTKEVMKYHATQRETLKKKKAKQENGIIESQTKGQSRRGSMKTEKTYEKKEK